MPYTGQEVAAAILFLSDCEMHYKLLADEVVETRLSGLQSKGGEYPEEVLLSELTIYYGKKKLFTGGDGHYSLHDPEAAAKIPRIAEAIERVRMLRLKSRIKRLRELLDEIPEVTGNRWEEDVRKFKNDEVEEGIHTIYLILKKGMGNELSRQEQIDFKYKHTRV